jgi:hypothetical protein
VGTSEDPFLISSEYELGKILYQPLAAYRLSQNVDLSKISWNSAVVPVFKERFDGNGCVIGNLRINGAGRLGLFDDLPRGSKVSTLGLESVDIQGGTCLAGAMAGRNNGLVVSCYSSGRILLGIDELKITLE